MCTPASHWSLYSSFPSSGIYLLIPMIASYLDLLSLPRISHNTLFLNDLPYKQLRPISGVTPLPFAHSKLLPKISPTGPSHLQLPDIQLLSYLQKVKYCILNVGWYLPIPDIYSLHILGPVPQVPCQIPDALQVPLIPLPHIIHILVCLLSPEYPYPPPPIYLSSKYHLYFPPHLLVTCQPFLQW